MGRKKKILLVFAAYITRGGAESFLMNWISQAPRASYEFTWYYPCKNVDETFADEFRAMGVRLICGELNYNANGIQKVNRWIRVSQDIGKILTEEEYDIIHVNTGGVIIQAITLAWAKRKNIRIRIGHSHSSDVLFAPPLKKAIFQLFRMVVNSCVTKRVACSKMAAESLFGKKYVQNTLIVNNCIDTGRFAFSEDKRKECREKYRLQNCFVIGEVGLLSKDKNQMFLMDVFKLIYEKDNSARLILVGNGPDEDEIKRRACELGLEGQIIFPGLTVTPENYYCAMDVFVLPSPAEGLPFVGVEAQTSGLPCVFSDGVTREVDLTGNCKFISLSESKETWAVEILKLRECNIQRRNKVYEIIEKKHYGMSRLRQMLRQLYEEE